MGQVRKNLLDPNYRGASRENIAKLEEEARNRIAERKKKFEEASKEENDGVRDPTKADPTIVYSADYMETYQGRGSEGETKSQASEQEEDPQKGGRSARHSNKTYTNAGTTNNIEYSAEDDSADYLGKKSYLTYSKKDPTKW